MKKKFKQKHTANDDDDHATTMIPGLGIFTIYIVLFHLTTEREEAGF